jgi:GT2 family glycosyltransferase
MIDVSVLIVTWNSSKEIKACAESVIRNSDNLSVELIIIDNNSSDDTFKIINNLHYGNLHTYQNNENLGYTKAVNRAIRYSTGKNIFLLNPDTLLKENTIDTLNKFLNEALDYGACAPLMLNENGTLQYSLRNFPDYRKMFCEFSLLAYIFPKTKLFGSWRMKYYDYSKDSDINQPMAAALMIKRELLDKIETMDERFEMFFNDVDLCKRIIEAGKKIRLLTKVKVIHKYGESVYKDRVRMIKTWNKDCVKYFEKFHNNAVLLLWLKINLKISEIIRILFYKISN